MNAKDLRYKKWLTAHTKAIMSTKAIEAEIEEYSNDDRTSVGDHAPTLLSGLHRPYRSSQQVGLNSEASKKARSTRSLYGNDRPAKKVTYVLTTKSEHDEVETEDKNGFVTITDALGNGSIIFHDLLLKTAPTAGTLGPLFETQHFEALHYRWQIRARIDFSKQETLQIPGSVVLYQLVLLNRIPSRLNVKFMTLRCPSSNCRIRSAVQRHIFTKKITESPWFIMPFLGSMPINFLLSNQVVNFRFAMLLDS